MPPKGSQPSKKTEAKRLDKIVEDKTFGLKNKNKSKTVQKYVQNVTNNVKGGTQSSEQIQKKKAEEKAKAEREAIERDIFKPVITQKAPVGVDPKSIVCEFFKKGVCGKGTKCKFSHNLAADRMTEKIDLHMDKRTLGEEDGIETWDQSKLQDVVNSKQTSSNKNLPTKIVCKFFIEAIENKQYGWFWECPNGGDKCMYVHALPPGYEFKAKKKDDDEDAEEVPLEELIEEEKLKLTTRTPLTRETFEKWKADKRKLQDEREAADKSQRAEDIRSGRALRSGRDLFAYNPDLFVDDENVFETEGLEPEDDNEPAIHHCNWYIDQFHKDWRRGCLRCL